MDDQFGDLDETLIEEIGAWSERKHAITQQYSAAFTAIMSEAQKKVTRFQWDYIDGYAAAGLCRRRDSQEIINGSALNSLQIEPPFKHFVFIELNERKFQILRAQTASHSYVECINGDANIAIPRDIVPRYDFKNYRRAFCLLDPYHHKHLDWNTIQAIGDAGTIDLLVHFPTMPMNRGALHRDGAVSPDEATAMTRFWGDETWRSAAYVTRFGLFSSLSPEKATDLEFAEAFSKRLREVANFRGTTRPIPMLNSAGATLYYLIFALPIDRATRAAEQVARYFIRNPRATSRRPKIAWDDAV